MLIYSDPSIACCRCGRNMDAARDCARVTGDRKEPNYFLLADKPPSDLIWHCEWMAFIDSQHSSGLSA
jgi:hypothetical protein